MTINRAYIAVGFDPVGGESLKIGPARVLVVHSIGEVSRRFRNAFRDRENGSTPPDWEDALLRQEGVA